MTRARGLQALAVAAALATVAIYYRDGIRLLVWPDSSSYLVQALTLAGAEPYARPGDRGVGYPLLLVLALATPAPGLAIVIGQLFIAIAALAGGAVFLIRVVWPRVADGRQAGPVVASGVGAGAALAGMYGALHVLIASVLTEVVFAGLALLAVLAIAWLVMPGRVVRRPWVDALGVALVGALPALIKPHWQLAAPLIAVVAAGWLIVRSGAGAGRVALGAGALAMTLAATALVMLPDRLLGQRYSPREQALFGPRTLFCNHVHLMVGSLNRKPGLSLQDDPGFERELRGQLEAFVGRHTTGWRLLGFNGDLCAYDAPFSALLDRRFSDAREQGALLQGALMRIALADPWPYVRKVMAQMAHGLTSGFQRFAVQGRPELTAYHRMAARLGVYPGFAWGVTVAGEHGPLGDKARLDGTLWGRVVHGLLGAVFQAATGIYVLLLAGSLVAPWWRWRHWSSETRQAFLAFVGLPMAIVLAHHGLIALVHTFDVWRYAFNVYFVSVFWLGAAAMFWAADWHRARSA